MGKIPIAKTVEDAYALPFRNFLSLLGIGWLPMLPACIFIYFFLGPYVVAFQSLIETEDPSALVGMGPMLLLVGILSPIAMAMLFVGMAALALGQIQTPVYFYFSLGYPVWRLLGAMICAYLLFVLFMFVFLAGAGLLVGGELAMGGEVLVALLGAVGMFAFLPFLFYALLRLIFFILPVTVAEGRKVVRRSWALGRGNVWRFFVVLLAATIPAMVIQSIVQAIVFYPAMMSMSLLTGELAPEESLALLTEMFERMRPFLPVVISILIVNGIFLYGVLAATGAFAYRALVPVGQEPNAVTETQ